MTGCDDYIRKLEQELPDLLTTKDLVKIGFFKSDQAARHARKNGTAPDFFQLPHGTIFHLKSSVLEIYKQAAHPQGKVFHETSDYRKPISKSTC